jgi:hypothetical protein
MDEDVAERISLASTVLLIVAFSMQLLAKWRET